MNTTPPTSSLLLTVLLALLPVLGGAAPAPAKDADAALAKLALGMRGAIVGLNVEHAPGRNQPFHGVFISGDGLAVIPLPSLARQKKPTVWVPGGERVKELKLGPILAIIPDLEMALVKFDHRPKVWFKLAEKEPEIGESVALVPFDRSDAWNKAVPPVIGPILAKRSGVNMIFREGRFTMRLSLGAGLLPVQSDSLGPGCFAINGRGELVAFMGGTQRNHSQTLVLLNPLGSLPELAERPGNRGKPIPFPLSAEDNLIDLAMLDDDFRDLHMAIDARNRGLARHHLGVLLKRYPNSSNLGLIAATEPLLMNPGNPLLGLAKLRPDPKASKADQVAVLEARAQILLAQRDMPGAIRELEAAIKPGLAPPDYPKHRAMLAAVYEHVGQLKKADVLYRQVYPFNSESIDVVAGYEQVAIKLRNWKLAGELAARDAELARIYRPR